MGNKFYHNPRCRKSREALALLEGKGINPNIKLYLEEGLEVNEVEDLLNMLDKKPRDIIRKSEAEYKENNLKDKDISDIDLVEYIANNPKLLERPIFVSGKKAELGRPPENVLKIV